LSNIDACLKSGEEEFAVHIIETIGCAEENIDALLIQKSTCVLRRVETSTIQMDD
jgi:hypothetical protein